MATLDYNPPTLDLTGVRAGDANLRRFTLLADGAPWDLTGAVITAQAREKPNDDTVSLTAVVTITDAAAGQFTIAWPGQDVHDLLAGLTSRHNRAVVGVETWTGSWDMQVASGAEGYPQTVCAGKITCVADVTRP